MSDHDATLARRHAYTNAVAEGVPGLADWVLDAYRTVPRQEFLDRFFQRASVGSDLWTAVGRQNPEHAALCYEPVAWPIQLDHDPGRWLAAQITPVPGFPTAECPDPRLLAAMLTALDVNDGMDVLQVPTGSGYPAAVLCHRLTTGRVVTVDPNGDLAAEAHTALHDCGYVPTILHSTDITRGWTRSAPYHRVLSICAVPAVPLPWIAQLRPGGVLVTALTAFGHNTPIVRLAVDDRGHAHGRLLPQVGGLLDLPGRSRVSSQGAADLLEVAQPRIPHTGTRPTPLDATLLDDPDCAAFCRLALPGVIAIAPNPMNGKGMWLLDQHGSVTRVDAETGQLHHYGPRPLGDQLEAAYHAWCDAGQPARTHLGLTIRPATTTIWTDHPGEPLWTLATARPNDRGIQS